MIIKIEDYLARYGWQGTRQGNTITGLCPLHQEHRPSFSVYPHDDHWCCWHENRTGTLPGLINILEFGDTDTPQTWVEVYKRVEELHGGHVVEEKKQWVSPRVQLAPPMVSAEQRALLTAAMHWWHMHLWSEQSPNRGRTYFASRGISLLDLRFCVQLGYAPGSWSAEQDRTLTQSFTRCLEWTGVPNWHELALNLGLLSKKTGNLSLRDRVMFCSLNAQGECVFFQSRQVQFSAERPTFPYMSATGIRKVPFTIALPRVTSSLTHVESPFGVAILACYGLPALAWHGGPSLPLLRDPEIATTLARGTHIICTDNDVAHYTRGGEVYYPGDTHAQVLQTFFEEKGMHAIRVLPPARCKGLDEWIAQESIEPFQQQVQGTLATSLRR